MSDPVKRSYHSPAREQAARANRRAILEAGRELFVERGYAGCTMAAVAKRAGVSLDTVYASVGTKPVLVRLLVETAISGSDVPVEASQREYVQRIKAAGRAEEKLAVYARAITAMHGRLAPLVQALRAAAPAHPELAALWDEIARRRARNMLAFADDLIATGATRPDLTRATVADVVWSMNAPEYYSLLVHDRGWSPRRFERWLTEAWTLLLLTRPGDG